MSQVLLKNVVLRDHKYPDCQDLINFDKSWGWRTELKEEQETLRKWHLDIVVVLDTSVSRETQVKRTPEKKQKHTVQVLLTHTYLHTYSYTHLCMHSKVEIFNDSK